MAEKTYVAGGHKYPVVGVTSDGREIIEYKKGETKRWKYAIIGFANPRILVRSIDGTEWLDAQTLGFVSRKDVRSKLERTAQIGFKIVCWLVNEHGDYIDRGLGLMDEMVTSPISEIK